MAVFLRLSRRGFTLAELLIAGILLSIVFVAATTASVSALKFFKAIQNNNPQVQLNFVVEHIARKAMLANRAVVVSGGTQLKLRWDYQPGTFTPNTTTIDGTAYSLGSTLNTADDTWLKYGLIGNSTSGYQIYWKEDTVEAGEVTVSDVPLEPGLLLSAGSAFTLLDSKTVSIRLSTQTGTPPRTVTASTVAVTHATS
jgi:prepilin-type N-terminal cleavage/methylation domain-containing protein